MKIRHLFVLLLFVVCLLFSIAGLAYEGGKTINLNCKLTKAGYANCSRQTSWLGIIPVSEEEISGVHGTNVSEVTCDAWDVCTQLELLTEGGSLPIPLWEIKSNEARDAAKDINEFVKGLRGKELIIEGSPWLLISFTDLDESFWWLFTLVGGAYAFVVLSKYVWDIFKFAIRLKQYADVADRVQNGAIFIDERGNASLPDEYRSLSSDGEIKIAAHGGHRYVFFYLQRGMPGKTSGFMYRMDDSLPNGYELGGERQDYIRIRKRWFYFPPPWLPEVKRGKVSLPVSNQDHSRARQWNDSKEIPWD